MEAMAAGTRAASARGASLSSDEHCLPILEARNRLAGGCGQRGIRTEQHRGY